MSPKRLSARYFALATCVLVVISRWLRGSAIERALHTSSASMGGLDPRSRLARAEEERARLVDWTAADYSQAERVIGIPRGALPTSFQAYLGHLHHINEDWFQDTPVQADLERMLTKLERLDFESPPINRSIVSTNKDGKGNLPMGFDQWEQKYANDGWSIDVFDDHAMEEQTMRWLGERKNRVTNVWSDISKPVLKTDLLRYLALLFDGGIYTDSDTVPRANPSAWGRGSYEGDHGSLSDIHRADDTEANIAEGEKYTIRNPGVNVVIALEDNRWVPGAVDTWRGGEDEVPFRRVSFCQWTMLSKKLHPIFLDAVGTALENLDKAQNSGTVNDLDACELTGPAPFSDAVYRYLLAVHGITPYDIGELEHRTRFGDVIVYPPGAFGPMYRGPRDDTDSDIKMPVAHMYKARWRDRNQLEGNGDS